MNEITELTEKLGQAVLSSPEYAEFQRTQKAYQADTALAGLVGEFDKVRADLVAARSVQTPDDKAIDGLQAQLQQIYGDIMRNENMKAFTEASTRFEHVMKEIHSQIDKAVFGEQCTHDCSTCSGCH